MDNYKIGKRLLKKDLMKMNGKKIFLSSNNESEGVNIVNLDYCMGNTTTEVLINSHGNFTYLSCLDDNTAMFECLDLENPNQKQFKGWEILEKIDKGELKKGTELVSDVGYTYIIYEFQPNNPVIAFKNLDGTITYPESPALQNRTYTIKEKEYLTFDEAFKSNKLFKHKNFPRLGTIHYVLNELNGYVCEAIMSMLNEKAWEVEDTSK